MHGDDGKFKRIGESRDISVIGVNGSLLLSSSNRDDLSVKLEFRASRLKTRAQTAARKCNSAVASKTGIKEVRRRPVIV